MLPRTLEHWDHSLPHSSYVLLFSSQFLELSLESSHVDSLTLAKCVTNEYEKFARLSGVQVTHFTCHAREPKCHFTWC